MKLKLTIIAAVLAALAVAGVYSLGKRGAAAPGATPGDAAAGTMAEANNRFALGYYARLKDKEKGNIFFSPYSISTALAMTYEGARGKTAEEIASVFHFPDINTLRGGNAAAPQRYDFVKGRLEGGYAVRTERVRRKGAGERRLSRQRGGPAFFEEFDPSVWSGAVAGRGEESLRPGDYRYGRYPGRYRSPDGRERRRTVLTGSVVM